MADDALHFESELYVGDEKLLEDNKLRQAFKALMKRVEKARAVEIELLQGDILNYVEYLNHIKNLPLDFRMHTLKSLHEVRFLNDDIISAMFVSYRLSAELIVREVGLVKRSLATIVILAIDALNLSILKLKRVLTVHHAPEAEDIRCVFYVTRLAMRALPKLEPKAGEYSKKLLLTLTWHELIRRLDFFSKERKTQFVLIQELERYIDNIQPALYFKGSVLPKLGHKHFFLQVFPDQSDHLSEVVTEFKEAVAQREMLLFSLHDFLDAVTDKKRQAKLSLHRQKETAFRKREQLQDVILGADMILKSLLVRLRHGMRREVQNTQVILQLDAALAMAQSRKSYHQDHHMNSVKEEELPNTWDVLNYSVRGARLCSREASVLPAELTLGALVGMRWVGDVSGQVLGFVRWYKFQDNRYYVGIEFLGLACQLRRAVTMQKKWIVLQEASKQGDVWFPDYWVEEGMAFIMPIDGQQSIHCYVDKVLQRGVNYSRCKVVMAASGIDMDVEDADPLDIEDIYI